MKCELIGTTKAHLAQFPVVRKLNNQLYYLGQMPELTIHKMCVICCPPLFTAGMLQNPHWILKAQIVPNNVFLHICLQ